MEESGPFFEQPVIDQRHGFDSASTVAAQVSERGDLIRAALLHDIGKRRSRLNVFGRSVVSGLAKVGLTKLVGRRGGRGDLYLRHGELAADELAHLGAEGPVVLFARWHHAERPQEIAVDDWELLVTADR